MYDFDVLLLMATELQKALVNFFCSKIIQYYRG